MAAALLESMVKNHGFTDGNKRTAWLLTATFLDRSGFGLEPAGEERVDDLVVGVAEGSVSYDESVAWFDVRLVPTD
nr:type II toxin-antitoxin system death-on-curing family toxin [Hasllibacter halocynthiae]